MIKNAASGFPLSHPSSFNDVFLQVGSSRHQYVNSLQRREQRARNIDISSAFVFREVWNVETPTFIRSEQDPRMLQQQEIAHMKQVKARSL